MKSREFDGKHDELDEEVKTGCQDSAAKKCCIASKLGGCHVVC